MKRSLKMKYRLVSSAMVLIALALEVLLVGCSSSPSVKKLTSIQVSPATASIGTGATQQFTAMGTFSDNSTQDLTSSATWSSSTPATATINTTGLATGVAAGSTTITAVSGSVTGTATLTVTVTLTTITVTPATATITAGSTQQFKAMGTYSDNSTQDLTSSATWSSSATGVATINASGLATGVAAGPATITAASGSVMGTATLTVIALKTITVTPATASVVIGGTQQFTATGTYTDNSQQDLTKSATWSSTPTTVATITSGGLATGAGVGTAAISATFQAIVGTASLMVTGSGGSSSGSTGILVVPFGGKSVDAAYQPMSSGGTVQVINLDSISSSSALITSIPMPAGYTPNATAASQTSMQVVVVSYTSPDVQVIDATKNVVVSTFKSPVTKSADFSGGSCTICGVLINPVSNLAVLDTGQGYYTMDLNTGSFTPLVLAFTAENFSLDSTTQLIISPTYQQDPINSSEVQILNVTANTITTNITLNNATPDSAATDLSTNVAVVVEEYTGKQNLINLNEIAVSGGNWTAPTTDFPIPGCVGGDTDMTMIAVDSGSHTLFSSAEFDVCTAVESLPSSVPVGTPPSPTAYVWGNMPNTPDSGSWFNGGDPHGVSVFTSVVDGKHYGFLVNDGQNWVARVDLAGAQAAPPLSGGQLDQIDLTPYILYLPTTK